MRLMLTTQCSQRCPGCVRSDVSSPAHTAHMSKETLDAFIRFYEEIKPTPVRFLSDRTYDVVPQVICITGGECTEHPQFEEMVTHLVTALPAAQFYIETNGSWIGDEAKVDAMFRVMQHKNIISLAFLSDPSFPYYNRFCLDKDKFEGFLEEFPAPKQGLDTLIGDTRTSGKDKQVPRGVIIDTMLTGEMPISFDTTKHLVYDSYLACFYFQFLKAETTSFSDLLYQAESRGFIVSPLIAPTGTIHNGPSHRCLSLGHVSSIDQAVLYRLLTTIPECTNCHRDTRMTEDIARVITQTKRFAD